MKETYSLGVDIGGSAMKAGVLRDEEILWENSVPTKKGSASEFYGALALLVEEARALFPVSTVGFGFPALVDQSLHRLLRLPNLPALTDTDYLAPIKSFLPLPFIVDNDANLAAFGEYSLSSKKGGTFLLLTLGSGVGTGLVIGGNLFLGNRGFIEGGHIVVEPEGKICPCGSRGCLETETTIRPLKETYSSLTKAPSPEPAEIGERARKGEEAALQCFRRFGYYLGLGLTTFQNLLNPDTIVLGGGLSNLADLFLPTALATLRERSYTYPHSLPEIRTGTLLNRAGFVGAALYAAHKHG